MILKKYREQDHQCHIMTPNDEVIQYIDSDSYWDILLIE